ncbi:acetyl-CoA C-acyltransferase [Octadecabacter ascidiaceicola]|uniref:Acetyl-CoA acetyltransferase n=1 Tax=Octadecabacter ascidiaceicola TaxID=1655543 RepID=A0A238JJN2_9RHOB|nr:acetyl-CoA C-acyltransferase [Octadecabacter ascidiaceicola]SMX30888.1 Acetyl-CoA acetyltransferase [Octadecabacter ascidiaceicola]
MTDPIVILSAKRTPMGGLGGELSAMTASQLGAVAAKAAVAEAGVSPSDVDEVIFGNVLGAGQGQAPARQVAFGAGLSEGAVATTVNKMCGSGMKAAMLAHDLLAAGSIDMALAGGAESMSNAPYLLPKVRDGLRMGHGVAQDHMFIDGLEDAYEKGTLMGVFAERCATDYQFSREAQDAFAIASLERALAAEASGAFDAELAQTDVVTRRATTEIKTDEQPRNARPDKIPQLKPAFAKDGTVTAANASSISDGAAALILTRASVAKAKGLSPIAKITGHTSHGVAPEKFPIAPIGAVEKLLAKTGTTLDDYGLFEVNEAFAVVAMAAMHSLGILHDKVNVNGGACALGHPIGASGARIMVTLLHAMRARNVQRGMAAICIGGGEATAIGLELMEQT